MRNSALVFILCCLAISLYGQQGISKSWVADLGNGTYKNPILYADYSDPDVCRVGDDYYMTASSFNAVPGLPILHSKDMVNWKIIGHAIDRLEPDSVFSHPQHGNGVWAPSIRHHNGEFYIYYGDPDYGIYMLKAENPSGPWSDPVLVMAGKGLIDSCPLWDDGGNAYLVYAYAGSRAGIKSVLAIAEMNSEGTRAVSAGRIIYDGHENDPTVEGPKFHKRNGYYYIFAPAGGVATGWQIVLRSKNVFGPYERKVVMAQGNTDINGPHQGAWVDTPMGEDWFYHFQDVGAIGRIVHLQPMVWKNDWPVIGIDRDDKGWGEPVAIHRKPRVGGNHPIVTPAESDQFDSGTLGLQWQWHANPMDWWHFADAGTGTLHLYSVPVPDDYASLWDVPNLLLQKFSSNRFTATAKVTFHPSAAISGERFGFVVMGMDYALLSFQKTEQGFVLSQNECLQADRGGKETVNEQVSLNDSTLFFRVSVTPGTQCLFSYSTDGRSFHTLGKPFNAKEGKWIGAKMGFVCSRPVKNNDGGRAIIDWFMVE
ncbi:glycoside hydrolase 43 family protein [Proteiniphilum sp. X52]|uniref:glycoside hydrolase family 43 protein n=1 Tax=Proteiniphilum sp. X52 TaxID=2382159 RepID=UPI000F09C4B5|nr:glycoside hydrolase 43 family protein [Proteiniphilum sp. X52]RNC66385.1 glycoside hydrolase [Proteiniphilum sp. X52]